MRALIQRVSEASVTVDQKIVGEIGPGLLVLICAMQGDSEAEIDYLAGKIAKLRIFKDSDGKMNRSVKDISGSILVVSQFTLAADTRRGNRPGFSNAASPQQGEALYLQFSAVLRELGLEVANGQFGADMKVSLLNDGPVTIWMDTAEK
ncbi:D-tyrosyl-tRNA deacylase [Roseobacter sp. SK209-2-6]|uniref:D-aminoacyl-tRNA deacylase n=1 Tax=Roseobacter sp. SK209-2-6 TaxID=388739 RepID=UPI0000F3F2BE|nr:D-aminoacyl-tRNA deacylase [Roseobacter sp. SK209-2-6]EBA16590.1 D-tyrosyl-tRNA deacylase [Roseobacter sp. SK209-2-6]